MSNLIAGPFSCFYNRMHCRMCLCVGVMRRTVTQESVLAIQSVPELTMAGSVLKMIMLCHSTHMQHWLWFGLFCSSWFVRTHSLETAREVFWKQADFGYVKERLSEIKALCKTNKLVSLLISLVPMGLLSQQEETTGRNSVNQKGEQTIVQTFLLLGGNWVAYKYAGHSGNLRHPHFINATNTVSVPDIL